MKRVLMVLTVALIMAAMLVASAAPAFAGVDCTGNPKKNNCFQNGGKFVGPGKKHPNG